MSLTPAHLTKIATLAARRALALVSGFHRRRVRLFDDELLLRGDAGAHAEAPCVLISGEPLPSLAALVAGTHASPSRRGRFALALGALELPAVADDGELRRGSIALHLDAAAARLALLRELLAPGGLLCVRADGAARVFAQALLDALCGAAQRLPPAGDAQDADSAPLVYAASARTPSDHADTHALAAALAGAGRATLARLLDALPNDAWIVLDGDAPALVAVDASDRRWFACCADAELALDACKQLVRRAGRAVLCQQLRLGPGRGRHTAREIATLALTLFGAEPLPLRRARSAAVLGRCEGALVFVDAPGATTTQRTIDWALAQRARAGLAHDAAVIVLGWRFAPDAAARWRERRDAEFELRAIPSALQQRLLRGDPRAWRGSGPFPGLGAALLMPIRRRRENGVERLSLRLQDYVLCAPHDAPLAGTGLDLIEFWSIDADFDGVLFRAVWQCARGDDETFRDAVELVLPWCARTRRVALRFVDCYGQRTEIVQEVPPPPGTALRVREKSPPYASAALLL